MSQHHPDMISSQEDADREDQRIRDFSEALDHIEHLLRGPGTHRHSTDYEPGCEGCEGQRRWDDAREFLRRHGRKPGG